MMVLPSHKPRAITFNNKFIKLFIISRNNTVYNRTVLKNGSCYTVRPGKVSCLQKFRHFWMIIRDLLVVHDDWSTPTSRIVSCL